MSRCRNCKNKNEYSDICIKQRYQPFFANGNVICEDFEFLESATTTTATADLSNGADKSEPEPQSGRTISEIYQQEVEKLEKKIDRQETDIKKLKANQFPDAPICSRCGKPRKSLGVLWENHIDCKPKEGD